MVFFRFRDLNNLETADPQEVITNEIKPPCTKNIPLHFYTLNNIDSVIIIIY